MNRWMAALLLLASCADSPETAEEDRERIDVPADQYAAYHFEREGTVRFAGTFESVVTIDETYIKYGWRFRGAPEESGGEPGILYIDDAKSGIDIGPWRGKKVVAVGRLRENQQVGHERTPGWDVKKPIVAPVLELVAIDVIPDVQEKLPSRIAPR
jgi:hypothetical protein